MRANFYQAASETALKTKFTEIGELSATLVTMYVTPLAIKF